MLKEHTYPRTDGLPQFLAAIGSTLKDLTLHGPRQEIDENLIVRNCTNPHTLSLCGGIVDVQLNLSDYRYKNLPIPEIKCHWYDVVRRLRLRLNDRCKHWKRVAGGYDFNRLPEDMKAMARMLTVNRHLAYLDVLMLTGHRKHGNLLKKHHLKPIDRPAKLDRGVKLAFLSAISARMMPAEAATSKRARQTPGIESVAGGLDQRVISQTFSFAGPPLLRRVYLRITKYYCEPYDDFYGDYDEEDDGDGEEKDGA
ncbi:uncharacterized protein PITG_12538 [Phytophthora infestans T30-4]|uniref:Uncharacterized protein n=1 Tax=Phytophthora infestans (strain T30-4) TaxID=403677 RepID=D0NKS5_PHYIT|nr:uncharacterized protein PITG_12538 [Phytophthora infestans T30-4]EEY60211.1 conserved hypothetical protein [Phytophthora infestans T30-4]|eukprot:XP_002900418.1 conserved hypothetical protein [Phytophthora infestans T30-4]